MAKIFLVLQGDQSSSPSMENRFFRINHPAAARAVSQCSGRFWGPGAHTSHPLSVNLMLVGESLLSKHNLSHPGDMEGQIFLLNWSNLTEIPWKKNEITIKWYPISRNQPLPKRTEPVHSV